MQILIETLENKNGQEEKNTASRVPNMAHVVKPAKVPTWTINVSLETFGKQLDIWQAISNDVPETIQFQDLIKSLKINKNMKGLSRYVGEHILSSLNNVEKQKIKEIIEEQG